MGWTPGSLKATRLPATDSRAVTLTLPLLLTVLVSLLRGFLGVTWSVPPGVWTEGRRGRGLTDSGATGRRRRGGVSCSRYGAVSRTRRHPRHTDSVTRRCRSY